MKRVLIMVLSANIHPYAVMMHYAAATWDHEPVPGTRTVFYHGNPQSFRSANVVSFPVDEDYKTIMQKNLMAFSWALQDGDWDYMARVNASCYVHKRRLLEACQSLPERGVVRGILAEPTCQCGVDRQWMWGGGQFIFSRDVVRAMVQHPDLARSDVMEDVALGEMARELGYEIDGSGQVCSINRMEDGSYQIIAYGGAGGFSFLDPAELSKLEDQYFIRCKHDPDRAVDFENMKLLKQYLKP